MFENESWRRIEGFPQYFISDYGRVKHENRSEARKVTINDKGFPIITLFGQDSKTRYLRQINKLVADAFLSPPDETDPYERTKTAVWHIDGDLTNCRVENLKWETRPAVLEWNEMHRSMTPAYRTPKVKNNLTGRIYANAFECAINEGVLESKIVWRIEKQARSIEDDNARYRYVFGGNA